MHCVSKVSDSSFTMVAYEENIWKHGVLWDLTELYENQWNMTQFPLKFFKISQAYVRQFCS